MSCFPVNSLLLSTLECLYNQSCIQMLLDWRLFEVEQVYRPVILNVSALDSRLPSRYLPNTIMNVIVSNLMIEDWINTTNVTAHYDQCNPRVCTYTYTDRYNIFQVIATILGLVGGLNFILHRLVPIVVKIISSRLLLRRVHATTESNHAIDQADNRPKRRRSCTKCVTKAILSTNIFNNETDTPFLATRIYLILLYISLIILMIFAGLTQQTRTYTVKSPSEATFEIFHNQYQAQDISCPCSRTSIEYDIFLSVSAVYHQICSSGFIASAWWTLVANRGDTYALKDQPLLSAYFRMIASFCRLANQTVTNAAHTFASKTFVSVEAITSKSFEIQVASSLNTFIQQTPLTFLHTLQFIRDAFRSNQLQNMFMTTWEIAFTTAAENYIVATIPRSYNNGTCLCATSLSATCWRPLDFVLHQRTITLPGLVGGCLPVDGLRQSTMECLFDSTCLSMLSTLLNSSMVPPSLNTSVVTRFPYLTTKLGTIIDELFVEEWINASNFSAYYQACSPRLCQVRFNEHNNAIYIITTLLGFYGGLT
ncbi:unnamed protein product, partial [Rotaria sordida]